MPNGPMINPAVIAVAMFVAAALSISFANRRQRKVLWVGVGLATLMVLFPPWIGWKTGVRNGEGRFIQEPVSTGYAPIWSPPQRTRGLSYTPMRINRTRLAVQASVVVAATAVGVAALRRRRRRPAVAAQEEEAPKETEGESEK